MATPLPDDQLKAQRAPTQLDLIADATPIGEWLRQYPNPPLGTPQRAVAQVVASAVGNSQPLPRTIRVPTTNASAAAVTVGRVDTSATSATVDFNLQWYEIAVSDETIAQSQLSLADIAIEHAHALYAHGSGDVVGEYSTRHDADSNTTRIRYPYYGLNQGTTLTVGAPAYAYGTNASVAAQLHSVANAQTQQIFLGNILQQTSNGNCVTVNGLWGTNAYVFEQTPVSNYQAPPETAEQVAAREARAAKVAVVAQKAERLLLAHLTDAQRQTYLKDGYFDVATPSGRTYRIKNHYSGNVYLLAGSQAVRKYCAGGTGNGGCLPLADYLFTQLITLRFNEREFLRQANTWAVAPKLSGPICRAAGLTDNQYDVFVGQGADADMPAMLPLAA